MNFNFFTILKAVQLTLLCLLSGCGANDLATQKSVADEVIGYTSVPLDVDRAYIRVQESEVGNLIADAMLAQSANSEYVVDFAVVNAGGIRVDLARHPDGIYPVGDIELQDAFDMLPFGNSGVICTLDGMQIKQMFERSVSQLPVNNAIPSGGFLQVSGNVAIVVDLARQSQQISNDGEIITQGMRITEMLLDGNEIEADGLYQVFVPSFIASGGDNYVVFAMLDDTFKQDTEVDMADDLVHFFKLFSPVAPKLEKRITFIN